VLTLGFCTPKKDDKSTSAVVDSLKIVPANQYVSADQSPMDISYYPTEFPQHKLAGSPKAEMPVARVIYSRPHKKGRMIFSNSEKSLCPYGKPWRLGANEATEIEFFIPVVIDGKNVGAGRYVLYCVPFADKWIIALNSNIDSWGLAIDAGKDILRTEVPAQQQAPALEDFTIVFASATYGADIIMAWDDVKTVLPLVFSH
jgi:hypothetical protein